MAVLAQLQGSRPNNPRTLYCLTQNGRHNIYWGKNWKGEGKNNNKNTVLGKAELEVKYFAFPQKELICCYSGQDLKKKFREREREMLVELYNNNYVSYCLWLILITRVRVEYGEIFHECA
jgi:hypothetical protein